MDPINPHMKNSLLFIIIICFLNCNAFSKEMPDGDFEAWYNSLSENEKIAQVFVTGIKRKTLAKDEKQLLRKWPLGGIIYFKRNYRNPSQFLELHNDILSSTKFKPFTFTDQEGGDVVRIGTPYDAPTPLSVGMLKSAKVTNYLGQAYGSLLSDLGIASNLAPVVDVRSKSSLDFISTRSFSSSPKVVANMSLQLSKGMLASGVIPTLKHFPGLGGVKTDSHKELAVKKTTYSKISRNDWLPYKKHTKAGIPFFVMTSHTQLILDKKDYGIVTYSPDALKLLRKTTSEDQVAITDDLEMGGAKIQSAFGEAAYKSFMAGHNLVLIGWAGGKLKSSLKFFKKNAKKPEFKARLKESLARLYKLKKQQQSLKGIASQFSKHGSLKLTSVLNSKISAYLLDKEVSKIISRKPASSNEYFYFSSDRFFRRSFSSKNHSSLLSSSAKFINSKCQDKTCVLHLSGAKTADKIHSILSQADPKNFIVLNSADPHLLSPEHLNKIKMINSYTKSYALSKQVRTLLEGHSSGKKKSQPEKVAGF